MSHERESLLENLKSTFQSAMTFLDTIDPTTVIFHDSGCTVRDLIDHVAMWEAEKVKGLDAFVKVDVYITPDFTVDELHDYNRRMRDARLLCSVEEVFASWRSTRHQLIAIVEAMTDAQLKSAMTPPWGGAETMQAIALAQDAIRHQEEHMAQIMAVCTQDSRQ